VRFPQSVLPLTILSLVAIGVAIALFYGKATAIERNGAKPLEWAEPARLAERSLLLDIAAVGERVIAVGERGHALVSENAGSNWTQAQVPTRSMLTAVAMVDARHSWAVGHDAVILHSADGGNVWTRQFFAPEKQTPLLDVWFADSVHGLAVGAYGLVLETHDGGKNWKRRIISEEEPHFYAITEGANGTLYVAGEFGSLFRSRDRGKTWQSLGSPYKGSFFGALAHSGGALLVFGLRGNLYRSEDSGQKWRRVETGTTASLMSGTELADGAIVIVGLSGTVLVSRDEGRSFTKDNRTNRQGIAAVAEAGSGQLLMVGEAGLTRSLSLSTEHSKTPSGS
jgi:photosystem II stability/assembly factor-like uncharacterized protein